MRIKMICLECGEKYTYDDIEDEDEYCQGCGGGDVEPIWFFGKPRAPGSK